MGCIVPVVTLVMIRLYNLFGLYFHDSLWLFVCLLHSHSDFYQASQDKKTLDVGANLFIGNLDPVSIFSPLGVYDC